MGSYRCSCNTGYTLNSDGFTCDGIYNTFNLSLLEINMYIDDTSENNECSSNATEDCEQICINTPGSYMCQCNAGFRLNVDGRTCDGIKAFVTSSCS